MAKEKGAKKGDKKKSGKDKTSKAKQPPARDVPMGAAPPEFAGSSALPEWFPPWAKKLAELYFSGTTSMFVVHGNTYDLIGTPDGFVTLPEFLAEQVFGRWDIILHYDLARGLRALAGRREKRLQEMVATINKAFGDISKLPREPGANLGVLDRFVQRNVMLDPKDRLSVAVVLNHVSHLVPRGDRMNVQTSTHLVTLLNWAASPYVKRLNMAFVLIDSAQGHVSERLTQNPHVADIELPLPELPEREEYLQHVVGERDVESFSDYSVSEVASLTAGISLTDLGVLVRSSIESGRRLDQKRFQDLKKRLIERQAQGLLEFVEPRWGLGMVVGHEAAKARLKEDATLLRQGKLESVPMGYLFCGPVGTGKSFLAQCMSGDIGIPTVQLKNFRSKYVGESESNLERVLSVLRSMGPVVVTVDEADAMLGDRDQGGDSGVGSRIFGMIASQMGDTRYRGKILWVLLTARPDLLPIDIKRQGRAEVHIPLFYPEKEDELRDMFVVMARKAGASLAPEHIPPVPHKGDLSGADIEGIIGRAWRTSLLAGSEEITEDALRSALDGFMPSTQSLEREMQEIAAIIECTDRAFLTEGAKVTIEKHGGRAKLQERMTDLKRMVEAM